MASSSATAERAPGVYMAPRQRPDLPAGTFTARTAARVDDEADAVVEIGEIEEVAAFEVYSIRNGRPADVRPYLSRPSIPNWAKWVVIPGLQSTQGFACLDAVLRAHIYHVTVNGETAWGPEKRRKVGLMLGAMRASMMVNYHIGQGDLMAGEMVVSPLAYEPAIDAVAGANARPARAARYVVRLATLAEAPAQGADPNAAERARRAVLTERLVLTQGEKDVLAVLARCGQAALPIQGYSLVNDGHHYLSEGNKNSFRAFQTVERQLWVGQDVAPFFNADLPDVRNVMWHKAGHPVRVPLKHELATDEQVKDNLLAADLGSAASRLPAIEAVARSGSAYLALVKTVSALWEQYGAWIAYDYLEGLMGALAKCTIGVELPEGGVTVVRARVGKEKGPVSKAFLSRKEVLDEIQSLCVRSASNVAMAAGFYKAYLSGQETSSRGSDSLLKAFSISNLEKQHPALFHKGAEMHLDYRAFKATKRAKNEFDITPFAMI